MTVKKRKIDHYLEIIDEIVLATPKGKSHDPLIDLANHLEIGHYQGSEYNVMERVVEAGKQYSADIISEVTGDCPIIDSELVQQLIKTFLSNQAVYESNSEHGLPDGIGAQVFYLSALEKSYGMTDDLLDLEHVTWHIRKHKAVFSSLYLAAPGSLR
jgi:spore coat polysaccharide biosynthesis protein SpsF